MTGVLTDSGKLFLLAALLAKDRLISNNGKVFLKELILRGDSRLSSLLEKFESKDSMDSKFLEEVHALIQEESSRTFDALFYDTSLEVGKGLSKNERDTLQLNHDKSLIYGEVDYTSFYRVLRKINPSPGLTFYDLGSGTSKAVFAARLTQDFGRCIGIEILQSLHKQARKVVERYNDSFKEDVLALGQSQHASVYLGSFLDFDWSDGDVIFANSTCFDDSLMSSMATQAETLHPGSIFVTFTKALPSKKFELLERKRYKMSWGPATVFIQRRVSDSSDVILPPYRLNTLPSDDIEYVEMDDDSLPPPPPTTSTTTTPNKTAKSATSSTTTTTTTTTTPGKTSHIPIRQSTVTPTLSGGVKSSNTASRMNTHTETDSNSGVGGSSGSQDKSISGSGSGKKAPQIPKLFNNSASSATTATPGSKPVPSDSALLDRKRTPRL